MFEGILQPTHLILILVIALVVFGPGKLSDVGSSLGKSLRDFKKAVNEDDEPAPTNAQATARPRVHVAGETAAPEADNAATVESPRA
jgi:sec-independent protein translocase protein TatA